MSDWFQLDKEYMMSTYCRTKVAIERGEGCKLYDVDGKAYIDLFSGVGVNVLGYNHPKIVQTTMEQVEKVAFSPSNLLDGAELSDDKML
ncbi:aminotransferase class III-fold pyridoxal phosphate-dependent enzyme, partial [Bacillus thuringiensis]|nr:aminotransferase class III-fold pyridoxal phosphate-dependent enzyme [Bacillus thuringiensis]